MLMGILGHVADYDEARSIVRQLLDPLPSGSYLTLNDGTDVSSKAFAQAQEGSNQSGAVPTSCGAPSRSRASSRVSRWWSRGWCHVPGGVPIPPTLASSCR
jgi:S-adenosyl methyltransferase